MSNHPIIKHNWSFCPECGSLEKYHTIGTEYQCKECGQDYFSDIDYSEEVRGNLQKALKRIQELEKDKP